MNKGHKLVKNNTTVQTGKKAKIGFNFYFNTILILLLVVVVGIVAYTPFKYSTAANGRIVRNLTNAITSEVGGIIASAKEVDVEGYDYKVTSSQDYITALGDKQLSRLKRLEQLGVLKTNIDIDDLWAVYYAYYSTEYNNNLSLNQQLTAWFSDLQKTDVGDYVHHCTGEGCTFISELTNIIAVDSEWLKNSTGHAAYHKQVEESVAAIELDKADMQNLYEAYVLTNPEFIESMSLDVTILNHTLLEENAKLANWALNSPVKEVNAVLGTIKYSVDLDKAEVAEIMQFVDFTSDDEIITDEVVPYVPNSLLSFGVDEDGLNTGNTVIVNVTNLSDIENLEEWRCETSAKTYYKDATTDEQFIDLGYAELHWDVKSIDYVDSIPTLDELLNDADWVNRMQTQLIEQAVWQMFYSGE